jgi:Ser/Thr protein kinase RdoA (MazF antagonist)
MLQDHLTIEQLSSHLEQLTTKKVLFISKLDHGVYHVKLSDKGDVVARVFPSQDDYSTIKALSALLGYLSEQGYPAERVVPDSASSVSILADAIGSGCVLLTRFAPGNHPERNRVTFYRIGALLAKLHALPIPEGTPTGGTWHHLKLGGDARDECHGAMQMLEKARQRLQDADEQAHKDLDSLSDELRRTQDMLDKEYDNLPKALVHPDLVPANIIAQEGTATAGTDRGEWTIVDWAGAGVGVRIFSLAFVLFIGAIHGKAILLHAVMKAYRAKIKLEEAEMNVLPQAAYFRFLTIKCWEVGMGRQTPADVAKQLPWMLETAEKVTSTVRKILTAPPEE